MEKDLEKTREMKEYTGKELIIMACSKCNIGCKHCYISYEGDWEPYELLQLVKGLKDKYELNINGAEVLTDVRYLESYKEIGQYWVLSNGMAILTNPDIVNDLIKNGIITVSLSYHFGIHNEISTVSMEKMNKILDILKKAGIQYKFMTTITSKNFMMIETMCDEAVKLGAKGIKFTNYLAQGNALTLSRENILSQEEKNAFFSQLMRVRDKYSKDMLQIDRCGSFGKNSLSSHDHFYCDCMSDSVVLTPNGYVYPCVFLAKSGYEIGKLIDGKIMIDSKFLSSPESCLADDICNREKKLTKKPISIKDNKKC